MRSRTKIKPRGLFDGRFDEASFWDDDEDNSSTLIRINEATIFHGLSFLFSSLENSNGDRDRSGGDGSSTGPFLCRRAVHGRRLEIGFVRPRPRCGHAQFFDKLCHHRSETSLIHNVANDRVHKHGQIGYIAQLCLQIEVQLFTAI